MTKLEQELLEALRGATSIVKAFSYTNVLGRTQRARMEAAEALIARALVQTADRAGSPGDQLSPPAPQSLSPLPRSQHEG